MNTFVVLNRDMSISININIWNQNFGGMKSASQIIRSVINREIKNEINGKWNKQKVKYSTNGELGNNCDLFCPSHIPYWEHRQSSSIASQFVLSSQNRYRLSPWGGASPSRNQQSWFPTGRRSCPPLWGVKISVILFITLRDDWDYDKIYLRSELLH